MKKPVKFIVIDDDESTNLLCEIIVRRAVGRDVEVKTFTLADHGVNYLREDSTNTDLKTIIFLDINMPVTTGWDALSMLEKLENAIKKQLTIFMLSSSIDPNDKKRSLEHPLVFDFIEKPLTIEKLENILNIDI